MSDVIHEESRQRFLIEQSGKEAFLAYQRRGDVLDFYHVFVPPELRGGPLASSIVRAGFDYARSHNLKVKPTCPYVSGVFLKRNGEYADLVK